MIAAEAAVTRELTVAHGSTRTHTLGGCKVTSPIANYCHRARAFGAGAPNYTAQPQQGRCAQQSFVRLIICLGLVIAVRTGTQVIVW